jgi:hypothetical protein
MSSIFTSSKSLSPSIPGDGYANTTIPIIGARLQGWSGSTWNMIRAGVTGIMTSVTGILNALPISRYLVTQPTLSDGYATEFQGDYRGNIKIAEQYAPKAEDNNSKVLYTIPRAVGINTDADGSVTTWTNYHTGTTKIGTAGLNIKSSPGRIRMISGENVSTTATDGYYLVLVDKATAPVNGDAVIASTVLPPKVASVVPCPANILDFGAEGTYCAAGISFAISSTPEKVTLGAQNYYTVWARYI